MIKKSLAFLALGGLGALAIVAPKSSEIGRITKNEQSNIEMSTQITSTHSSYLETIVDTSNQKTFNLPKVTSKDTLYLAAAILGEASGETNNLQYIKGVISGIFNRAEDKGGIKRAILGKTIQPNGEVVYHYTPFDPRDPNYQRVTNFLNSEKARKTNPLFRDCYSLARDALNGTLIIEHPLSLANYFVVRKTDPRRFVKGSDARKYGVPSWTYKMTEDGKFVLDKNKNRIPLEPVAVVPVSNGKKAFFYSIED